MMDTLEELKRERARLENEAKSQREIEDLGRERKKIESDIWGMKHKKTVRVINIAKKSTQGVGMIFGMAGRAVAPHVKKGLVNFANNANKQYREMDRSSLRRVKKVIKRSPKRKRVVRVKVKKRRDNPFDFFG